MIFPVDAHFAVHLDPVAEFHPVDDFGEPLESAQSPPAALRAHAELEDHGKHSVTR